MKYTYIILILLLFVSNATGQRSNKINRIEIYALKYDQFYIADISKKDIKKNYEQYVRVLDNATIQEANLDKYIRDMEPTKDDEYFPHDYRAILIIHRSNGKKKTYYIASSNAGIVDEKGVVYKSNISFISSIYSFLPNYFLNSY